MASQRRCLLSCLLTVCEWDELGKGLLGRRRLCSDAQAWWEMECFGNEKRKSGLAAWEVWGDGRGMQGGEGFPGGSEVKASASNVGDLGSNPWLGRSPREGNGNPFQYSCLGNPMDGGAWWATVHGVTKSRTRLSDFTFTFTFSFVGQ